MDYSFKYTFKHSYSFFIFIIKFSFISIKFI
nr:MAG TPA: hypothetical protein [Caudoviricetes sp.]